VSTSWGVGACTHYISNTNISANFPIGKWVYFRITRSGNFMRVYTDGSLVLSMSVGTGTINPGGESVFLGGRSLTWGAYGGNLPCARLAICRAHVCPDGEPP
jgi:hypothetical protein